MADVRRKLDELAASRDAAREHAVAAMRAAERSIVEALAGDRLRLPNIGTSTVKYKGMQLVGGRPDSLLCGFWDVVLRSDGYLMCARAVMRDTGTDVVDRPLADADIIVEDVPRMLQRIACAIEWHMARCDRTTENNKRIGALAQRFAEALK